MSYTWSGRFSCPTSQLMTDFSESVSYDVALLKVDIRLSKAHLLSLKDHLIISVDEYQVLLEGLDRVEKKVLLGDFLCQKSAEDIHMNVERMLEKEIGSLALKLHVGRSRNDQVVTDMRLWIKEKIPYFCSILKNLQMNFLNIVKKNQDVITVAYTHMQQAQPVLLAHHFCAYIEMLERDKTRFQQAYEMTDHCPYGSGACVGSSFDFNRNQVAQELGFSSVTRNSLDATSDRDFICDFMYAVAMTSLHLSRFCEDWVLWSMNEFSFLEVGDAYCTGSSMMPNKKNVDSAELIRGHSASFMGDLMSLFVLLKGTPIGYHRDFQEDKRRFFDSVSRFDMCLTVCLSMVETFKFNQRSERDLLLGHSYATDIAEYLVQKGCAFRHAHHISGHIVKFSEDQSCLFPEWLVGKSILEVNRLFCPENNYFEEDFFNICPPIVEGQMEDYRLFLKALIKSKISDSGTGYESLEKQLKYWEERLKS